MLHSPELAVPLIVACNCEALSHRNLGRFGTRAANLKHLHLWVGYHVGLGNLFLEAVTCGRMGEPHVAKLSRLQAETATKQSFRIPDQTDF